MKKFFALVIAIFVLVSIPAHFALVAPAIRPYLEANGYQIGELLGPLSFFWGALLGWAGWLWTRKTFKPGISSSPAILAIDAIARDGVVDAAEKWAINFKETKGLPILHFQAEKNASGQVDPEQVYRQLAAWLREKVAFQHDTVYVVLAGTMGAGIVIGNQLANVCDGVIVEYQRQDDFSGYVVTSTWSKKIIGASFPLTPVAKSDIPEATDNTATNSGNGGTDVAAAEAPKGPAKKDEKGAPGPKQKKGKRSRGRKRRGK